MLGFQKKTFSTRNINLEVGVIIIHVMPSVIWLQNLGPIIKGLGLNAKVSLHPSFAQAPRSASSENAVKANNNTTPNNVGQSGIIAPCGKLSPLTSTSLDTRDYTVW